LVKKKSAESAVSALSPLLFCYLFVRIFRQSTYFVLLVAGAGRPEGGGPAPGEFAVAAGCVEGDQLFEGVSIRSQLTWP
jgi:hypothetical protein